MLTIDASAEHSYPDLVAESSIHKSSSIRRSGAVRSRVPGASLGLSVLHTHDLIHQLEHGFSFEALQVFASNSGISLSVITSIVGIPKRTLARRKAAARLTTHESERLLRLSTVFEKAVELFEGDSIAAVKWLSTPRRALDNLSPLTYCRTELGGREVENLIGRLEDGTF
jgi:putative toxin-antitoxin system antitoxin component (TIGR02293 family)